MINPDLPGQIFNRRWYRRHLSRWDQWFGHLADQPNLRYLEIGLWEGGSASYMMRHFFTHPTSRGIGIDPLPWGRDKLVIPNLSHFGDRFEIIKGYSDQVLRTGGRWAENEWLDLAYIDGDHTTEMVCQDAMLVFPLIKVGGYMVFDDYHMAKYGCPQGVNAFTQIVSSFIKINWTGKQLFLTKIKSLIPDGRTEEMAWKDEAQNQTLV